MLYQNTFLTVYIIVITAVLGAVLASFLNCMAWRIVHNESITKGRSHCAVCGHTLGALDLIPIFSYLFLGGRCRYCGEKISFRYCAVELITAVAFVLIVLKYDVSLEALKYLVLICILLALSLVDLDIYEIPDRFIVSGILWWIICMCFEKGDRLAVAKEGLMGALILGLGMLLISLLFDKITGKESLGGGDIKLFFMTGLYIGLAKGLFNLIVSCLVGIFFVIVMKQKRIPFGPAISIGVLITLLIGEVVVNWYLGLFYF